MTPPPTPRLRRIRTPRAPIGNSPLSGSVRRRLNFTSPPRQSPFTSPPRQSPATSLASPSPRTKLKRLQEVQKKNYSKLFSMLNENNVNHALLNSNNNSKNLNRIKNPIFLLSDVAATRNGKIKHVYSREYIEKFWKNRTIFKSPMTGLMSHPKLIVKFDKKKHLNTQVISDSRLTEIKENEKIISKTLDPGIYEKEYFVSNIKGKLPYAMKFIKYVRDEHKTIKYILHGLPYSLHLTTFVTFTKGEIDKLIRIDKIRTPNIINFIEYRKSKNINPYDIMRAEAGYTLTGIYIVSKITHEFRQMKAFKKQYNKSKNMIIEKYKPQGFTNEQIHKAFSPIDNLFRRELK